MDISCFLAREYQMAQVLKRKYIDYKNQFSLHPANFVELEIVKATCIQFARNG